jgi:release factor glutamine methyltransferase
MHSTPDFSHLTSRDFTTVYEPAEDTFLVMDALEKDFNTINDIRPLICVEVGSGSGAISTFLAKLVGPQALYLCTDINKDATSVTRRTGDKNGVVLNPVVADVAFCFLPRLRKSVDILIFNPPYVVTQSSEVGSRGIEASWAGGESGREVMDRLFPLVPELLSDKGIFYLVVIKENDSADIASLLSAYKLEMSEVLSRRSGPEHLSVLKFTRTAAAANS